MTDFEWPSGGAWTVAGLAALPERLGPALRVEFQEDVDDLGDVEFAYLEDDRIGRILLERHPGSPVPCTDVLVDSRVPRDSAVEALKRKLGPDHSAFAWLTAFDTFADALQAADENTTRRKPVIIVLHGPSGVGKDSVIEGLRHRTGIHRVISSTDRPPRPGEIDGVHYHFLSSPDFERRINEGAFIEYARVYDQWKGVERREIEPYLERGEDLIIRTDVKGVRTWRYRLHGAVSVILLADEKTLRRRRVHRDGPNDESHAIRDAEMDDDMADLPNNDYVVMNSEGHLERSIDQLVYIIERERQDPNRPRPRLRAESTPTSPQS